MNRHRWTKGDMHYRFWVIFDGALSSRRLHISDVSEGTGIRYQTIVGWRANNRLPDLYSAYLIADFLSIPLDVMCLNDTPYTDSLVWELARKERAL